MLAQSEEEFGGGVLEDEEEGEEGEGEEEADLLSLLFLGMRVRSPSFVTPPKESLLMPLLVLGLPEVVILPVLLFMGRGRVRIYE